MAIQHVNQQEFDMEVLESKGLVLVDFFATWCGPCRMLSPELEKVEQEAKDYATILKVDIDDNRDLTKKLGIMSVPTMILFKDGQEVDRIVGYRQSKDLIALLQQYQG